jgi:hypothetical protein
LLLFFDCICGIGHGIGLVKLIFFLFVSVSTDGTGGDLLELIPVVNDFVATGPALFGVMENGLAAVVVASGI